MKRIVCLTIAAAIAGCGETTIDSGKLEGEITDDAEREGLVLDDVDCPSPEVEEGDGFECTVTVKGEERQLAVQQRANEQVAYDLGLLLDFELGSDAGGDEAAVRFVIDAIHREGVTALCDYATDRYRRELGGESCAEAVIARFDRPMDDYMVSVEGDTATAEGSGYRVTLRRQRDGSWLIADVAG